jgi:capsular polysaccharide biosynthesis protein
MTLLRQHLGLMIALPILLALVAAVVCSFMPDQYTATTSMYVLSKNVSSTDQQSSTTDYNNLSAGQLLANDVVTIAQSDRVASDVAHQLGMHSLTGYKVNINSSTTSRIITLSVTGANPRIAARIANTYVKRTAKTAASVTGIPSVNVVDTAAIPTSPSGPRRVLYVATVLLAGLLLSAVIAVISDRMNTKVRTDEEAQEITGLPVVAHFPKVNS